MEVTQVFAPPVVERITRATAIARLREAFLRLTDEGVSMCRLAAERDIFCRGFRAYSDQQLRDRYWWVVRQRPNVSRAELEKIANDWQLAQQEVQDLALSCDVQAKVHDTCRGWHDFTNEQLAGYIRQFTGTEVSVT